MTLTIRDVINKKKRRGILVLYVGLAIMLADSLRAVMTQTTPVVAVLGFAVSGAGMLYTLFWIICPSCKGRLGYMATYFGGPFSISKKFRFCPFCGVDLDSEVRPS